jgi:hypothetical protein
VHCRQDINFGVLRSVLSVVGDSLREIRAAEASPERRRLCLEEEDLVTDEAYRMLEGDEDSFRVKVQTHEVVWGEQTIIDYEDYLSRAHDIECFLFFEARDRAEGYTEKERLPKEPLESIPEYPPDMPSWKIESARSRSSMRARRRSLSGSRQGSTEACQH